MPDETTVDFVRLARQALESWQSAGVTSLPHVPQVALPDPGKEDAPAPGPPPAAQVSQSAPSATLDTTGPSAKPASSLFDSPQKAVEPAVGSNQALSREERVARLTILNEAVRGCTRCEELAGTRTQTVFGVGDPLAKILFIGEAPGADEDRQGEPFVGRAGKLLNDIIAACRLKREQVYICNVLKCRPPGNRTPLPEECGHCREYLDGQLAAIDPEYIVCWGAVAAQNLLKTEDTIGRLRRRFHRHGRAKVLCTYHPSYLLRTPSAKKDVWEDMQFLFRDMGIDLTGKPTPPQAS